MHMRAVIKGPRLADLVAIPPRVWHNAGVEARDRIRTRTRAKGVDADGAPFAPYSDVYAKAKAKRSKLSTVGRVNLTGVRAGSRMLDTMLVKASATQNPRITIFFSLAEKAEIASYHMGEGRVDREFFALSDADVDAIVARVRQGMGQK